VVVSDPFSDWNVAPLASAPGEDAAKVDIEIEKVGPDVHVYYTPVGDKSRILLREKKGFAPPTDAEHETWWFGAMVCGPLSESTEGTVENWTFEPITGSHH
jgi:regulation of enolase protein 1 (concanavalin A-like superfamily)